MKIDVISVGRIKSGPFLDLWDKYTKRLGWSVKLYEIEGKNKEEENTRLQEKLNPRAYKFALDEKGNSLTSRSFAEKLEKLSVEGQSHIQFIIGGADGLNKVVRHDVNFLLSFGNQTWPHKMVRIMLIEQIYRASQIIVGHPYHRD